MLDDNSMSIWQEIERKNWIYNSGSDTNKHIFHEIFRYA